MNKPLPPSKLLLDPLKKFISLESSSGIILLILAVIALVIDNSPLSGYYNNWFHIPHTWNLANWSITVPGSFWINDILMAIFFLLVGLEIKREICLGELNSLRKIGLPAIAAVGGMVIPALIYYVFNDSDAIAARGWAIPTATDIAFALGIISLLGKRVPMALKFYLMALAIFDDLGAIVIIAIFYQTQISWPALLGIGICLLVLLSLNRYRITALLPYLLVGVVLWAFFMASGIHPTLAGVLLALTIPLQGVKNKRQSPLIRLEQLLHPWVGYVILPLFAFANAGVSFAGLGSNELWANVPMGIILGLFLGKQLGVFGASWLAIRCGMASIPKGANWLSMYSVAIICGVGFTMSLFIGNLAFGDAGAGYAAQVRFGVLVGSGVSGLLGYLLLRWSCGQSHPLKKGGVGAMALS